MNSDSVNTLINKSASLKSKLSQEHNLQNQVSSMSHAIDRNNGGNMFSSILFWVGIAILLIFLGFNVFNYLGDAGEYLRKLFAPVLSFFGFAVGETAKQTIQTASTGSQGIIGGVADAATSGINLLQSNLTNGSSSSPSSSSPSSSSPTQTTPSTQDDDSTPPPTPPPTPTPTPTPTNPVGPTEPIPLNNSKSGQAGYCFIGSENGFRSCTSVTKNIPCLSGEIFPTKDLCINPALRV